MMRRVVSEVAFWVLWVVCLCFCLMALSTFPDEVAREDKQMQKYLETCVNCHVEDQ